MHIKTLIKLVSSLRLQKGARYRLSLSAAFLLCLFWVTNVQAQVGTTAEYKFKAIFLYNFLQFVDWPQSSFREQSSPIVVNVLGNDMLGNLLEETVKNDTVKGHPVVVQQLATIEDSAACHVLFISRSEEKNLKTILRKIKGKSILAVSETDGFAQMGGTINFYFEGNKLRFEINLESARDADLVVSSKLIRLAKIVDQKTE